MLQKRNSFKYYISYALLVAVCCFVLVALVLSVEVSYAKYFSQDSINASSRVAKVIVNVEETVGNESELIYKSANYEYYFSVSNTQNGETSEVVVEYYINLEDNDKNYIAKDGTNAYKLYRIETNNTRTLVAMANDITVNAITLGSVTVNTDNTASIVAQTHNYVLVYYPISTTNNDSEETLFSIGVTASQLE